MKKKIIGLLFTIFVTVIAPAESKFPHHKIADLEKRLQTVKGKEKVHVLLGLAYKYFQKDLQKGVAYSEQALKLSRDMDYPGGEAEALIMICEGCLSLGRYKESETGGQEALAIYKKLGDKKGTARTLNALGLLYTASGDYNKVLENFMNALKIRQELGDKKKIAEVLNNIGIFYHALQKNLKAIEYDIQAVKIFEEIGDKYYASSSYLNIANTYNEMRNFKKAREYYSKALTLMRERKDKLGIARCLRGLGLIYADSLDYDKALAVYGEVLKILEEIGNKREMAPLFHDFGWIYFEKKNYKKSLEYHEKALKTNEEIGYKWGITDSLAKLSIFCIELEYYDKAKEYLRTAMGTARENNAKFLVSAIYELYSMVYEAAGDYKNAFQYHRRFHQTEKELLTEKSSQQVNELQIRYETEKKEKKIAVLEKDKKIRDLRLSKTRIAGYGFISGFILVTVILALLFKKYLYLFAFWKKQKYIGRFRLMDKVGSGAVGTVYKAHSITNKSEIAAVKILKDELFSDENSKKRFKQEAVIIDKLTHPNIIRIIERGEYKRQLFTAMEFLEGKTLENRLNQEKRLDIKECFQIMVQVSEAVTFIHGRNIIHRDLKPANIMLTENNGAPGSVKLLDFGLARMEFQTRLTQSGNFVGTIEYMSPEQVLSGDSSPANDIFSMGVIFYRMLSGVHPFEGKTIIEIMRQIIKKDPFDISVFRLDVPEALDLLVMKMIDKKPGQRPSAAAIQRYLYDFAAKENIFFESKAGPVRVNVIPSFFFVTP